MTGAPTLRERLGGWGLVMLVVAVMAHQMWPAVPRWLAGVVGWAAALLLWPRLTAKQRVPVLAMLITGVAGIGTGAVLGQGGLM